MNAELGTQLRVAGLVRSPDFEGALAYLDLDRGFALVARGATSLSDVIDPAVWVKEKLSVALVAGSDQTETPLAKIITALRSIHAELAKRPAKDRPWVSVLVAIFHAGEGAVVSAGDCACFRYRDGLLSRLERAGEAGSAIPPRGSIGSEQQVRLDVVPLRPKPGDLYIASTRPLREGELAALARDLGSARGGAELLRAGVEGSNDRGRLVIRVLEADEDAVVLPERAESLVLERADEPSEQGVTDSAGVAEEPLEIHPLIPDEAILDSADTESGTQDSAGEPPVQAGQLGAPDFLRELESGSMELEETPSELHDHPPGVPGALMGAVAPAPATAEDDAAPLAKDAADDPPRTPRPLAQLEDAPPWYEPIALWVAGALAIIALALLVKAILPGILSGHAKVAPPPAVAGKGVVDFFSDPSGAAVRVDGDWLDGKTPLAGVELDAGAHRIELDWGPAGTWRDTIRVTGGERLAVHPAIYGAMTLRSSDPTRTLDVYLDGSFAGTTPLRLDRVVVGRHLVRFGGPGATGATQEFDVLRDAPVDVVGNAGPAPTTGRLTVRSALLTDAGFEPGKSEPVWIDGTVRGVTPITTSLKPGAHSVRVARRGFPAQVTVIDVKAGGDHYVTAEFGARSEQPLQFSPPDDITISTPLPVTVTVPEEAWEPSMAVWLYAASPEGSFQAKRMTELDGGNRVYAAVVPAEVAQNSERRVRIYCKAAGSDGRELFTEIVTVPVRR